MTESGSGRSLILVALLNHACGSGPVPASRSVTAGGDDAIVASWLDLEPRLHAVYLGRIDLATGEACADGLELVRPPGRTTPSRLCTPLAEVVAWHTGHAVALPSGPSLWIATTRTAAGVERVAAAVAATPGSTTLDAASGEALAAQFRCGQLAQRWRIPASRQSCASDSDCRLFTGPCFAATVSVADADRYDELHRRWGGTCPDPAGGACPPASTASCIQSRCTIAEP